MNQTDDNDSYEIEESSNEEGALSSSEDEMPDHAYSYAMAILSLNTGEPRRMAEIEYEPINSSCGVNDSNAAEPRSELIREFQTGESESSSGDEFEKEMEAELSSTMEGSWTASATQVAGQTSGTSDNTSTANKQPI